MNNWRNNTPTAMRAHHFGPLARPIEDRPKYGFGTTLVLSAASAFVVAVAVGVVVLVVAS